MVVFGQGSCIRKSGCFRARLLYSGKSGFIRAKVVVFGQKWLYLGNSVLFGSSSKMRILGQKGKNPKNQKNLIFLNFSVSPFVITVKKNKYILF